MRRTAREFLEAMQEGCLALNLRLGGESTILTAWSQTLRKDDRVHRNVKGKSCDREDYVEPEIKLRNKEEQLGQLGNTRKKGNEIRGPKTGLKGRNSIVFVGDALMDKSNDWPNVLKNCKNKKAIAGDGLN